MNNIEIEKTIVFKAINDLEEIVFSLTSLYKSRLMQEKKTQSIQSCHICGCTDDDCHQCIEATGSPCYWAQDDLCSRCAAELSSGIAK